MGAIISYYFNLNFFYMWLAGALFYCLHLFLDMLTTYRPPLFYPFYKKEFKFDFETAVNPVLMLISLAILLLFIKEWTSASN